ncbi:hypothetical protein NDU88_005263 [Pleurodeles waltl]|uniref:Uncharacterized protein n=1 Tax=Pleurodeles waltl TaxID=8319 RepID=A0AAV7VIJ6_PLEWA|nr:hypothetical protein NDU88_005263 [Pleurodeles waltl]
MVPSADPEKKYPGTTADGSDPDPEEAGAAVERIRTNDLEPIGVLNPEWEEVEEESFSPGVEETKTENGTLGGVSTLNPGGGGHCVAEEPSITVAVIAEDVLEERRSGQARHVLGREKNKETHV